jgi:hypothetical protein
MAERDPEFLERFATRTSANKKRRYVAKYMQVKMGRRC